VTSSEAAFLALIASLPLMRPVLLEIGRYTIPAADFLFIVAALLAAVGLATGRATVPRSRMWTWLALYAAALSLSTIMSADRARSALKLAGDLYLLGLAGLAMLHVRSLPQMRRALLAWIAGTIVTIAATGAGLVLFAAGSRDPYRNQFLSIKGSLPEGSYPRVMGLFLNPNMYCAYLVASLAIVVTACRAGWMSLRAASVLGAAIVTAAVLSLSPGFGGMLLVLAFALWAGWKETRPGLVHAASLASAIGAIVFVAAITVSPAPGAALSLHGLRPSSRMLTWIGSIEAFPAHPWWGKGLGLEVVEIGYRNSSGIYELLTDAHNTWLSILVQCGAIGLAAFVAVIAAVVRGTSLWRSATTADRVVSGLTVAVAAGFIYQSFSGSFENTRHVWVLFGLLAAAKELREPYASIGRG
jgi:O-antigen ligase/polysaccharide polymerase Wzy-like membrane protein